MILVRHGQSTFNLHFGATRQDPGIVDPLLTDLGKQQVQDTAETLGELDLRLILASPYSRTLESAQIIAEQLKLPVMVDPQVRERAYFMCDIGSPRSQLDRQWPHFDFQDLQEVWWPRRESEAQLARRCTRFRGHAAALDNWRHIVVVTHWGFIRGLTGAEVGNATALTFDPDAGSSLHLTSP